MKPLINTNVPGPLKTVLDLESVLTALIAEYTKLAVHAQDHRMAMQTLDLPQMERTRQLQQIDRVRIVTLEQQRRTLVQQISRLHGLPAGLKLTQLAELYPARKAIILHKRDELKALVIQLQGTGRISTRVANSVLGHLNAAVRILAKAAGDCGLYNGQGMTKVQKRLGRLEMTG